MMAAQTESSYNPARHSSGKRNFPLAAKVARELELLDGWTILGVIDFAIRRIAERDHATPAEAAEMLIDAALEYTEWSYLKSFYLRNQALKTNTIDRFWFEDSRWKYKQAYAEFLHRNEPATPPDASTPPDATVSCRCNGRGYVFNYGPGARSIPCPECASTGARC